MALAQVGPGGHHSRRQQTTCTNEVGAPVMDEWILVISAANAAFVSSASTTLALIFR
jgi:hypothetical protein